MRATSLLTLVMAFLGTGNPGALAQTVRGAADVRISGDPMRPTIEIACREGSQPIVDLSPLAEGATWVLDGCICEDSAELARQKAREFMRAYTDARRRGEDPGKTIPNFRLELDFGTNPDTDMWIGWESKYEGFFCLSARDLAWSLGVPESFR